jgi:hypothetical protein
VSHDLVVLFLRRIKEAFFKHDIFAFNTPPQFKHQ